MQGERGKFRAIGESAAWSVLNAAASQGISLLGFLVTARFISPAAFGVVAIATLTIEAIKRLFIEPLAVNLTASYEPDESAFNRCFSAVVTLAGLGSIIAILVAYPLALIIDEPSTVIVLPLLSTMLLGMGLSRTHEVWYSKRFEFRILALRSSVAAIAGALSGILMALAGFGIWSLVAQQLVNTAVACYLLFRFSSWRPRLEINIAASLRQLAANRHLIVMNAVSLVASEADVFFVTAHLGAGAGGVYNAAKRLILAASLIVINSVQGVILVSFAATSRSARSYSVHLQSLKIFAVIITPMYVGLSILGRDVVTLLLDARWSHAGPILSVLAVSALGQGLALLETNYLIAVGADRPRTTVFVASAAAAMVALPFLAPHGALPVAEGVLAINWLSLLALCGVAARHANEPLTAPLKALLLPAAGAASMIGASSLLHGSWPSASPLLGWPPILLLVYAGTICLLGFAFVRWFVSMARAA